jgi:hypothetical protein
MPKTTKHPPFTAAEARREADEHDRQGSDFGDFAEWIALRNDFHRLATTLRHYADLLEELDEAFASTEARTISRLEAATGRVKNPKHLPSPELTARRFHEAYERLAPTFGYTTRPETREFDPESSNGKLMTAVCREVLVDYDESIGGLVELLGIEADEVIKLRADIERLTKPITMQDVRLFAGEGKLRAVDVLSACNAVLRDRARLFPVEKEK